MQCTISTSTHDPHTTHFNTVHRRDLQDSSPAGRPFAFVPKRRPSNGSPMRPILSEDTSACPSSQQGQIRLVDQTPSDDSTMPQTTPRNFCTFPRIKSELSRRRIPQNSSSSPSDPPDTPTELDILKTCSPVSSDQPEAHVPSTNIRRTPTLSDPVSPEGTSSTLLLRKKSGELVKPSLKSAGFAPWAVTSEARTRTKSAPSTPIVSKSVHFDAQLEHVKLFLAEQKPLAVSRDGSPTETSEGDTTDTGFPFPRMTGATLRLKPIVLPEPPPEPWTFDVRLERLSLEDTTLVGQVVVRNVAFAKWVAVRFTLDAWQTTSEVAARHLASIRNNTFDRFEFRVRLADYINGIEFKRLIFCVRFSVEGKQMWDSNGGKNYELAFERVKDDTVRQIHPSPLSGARTAPALVTDLRKQLEKVVQNVPRSGSPPPVATVNRKPPRGLRVWLEDHVFRGNDDDDDDNEPALPFRPHSRSPSPLDDQKTSGTPSLSNRDVPLSARYDFGASLRRPSWIPPQVHSMPPAPASTTSRPQSTHHPRSPPLSSNLTTPIQIPRAGHRRRSQTVLVEGSSAGSRHESRQQGSPRDSADEGVEEHRHNQRDDTYDEDRPRRHTRGWVRDSSFEPIGVDRSSLKKTPPGMPTVTPPTPPRDKFGFHFNTEGSSSSSSCSPSVSPSTSLEPFDNIWPAVRRHEDDNSTSTPSISASSSSATESPLLLHGELPRPASDDALVTASTQRRSNDQRLPINSTPYYSFLDQFCFFTGVTSPRRVQSASTVEDYFSRTPPHHDDDQSPPSQMLVTH